MTDPHVNETPKTEHDARDVLTAKLVEALQTIIDSDDMAAELFTSDADRASSHADRARAALAEYAARG